MELLDGRSAAFIGSDLLDLHDVDGVGTGTMASAHITIWRTQTQHQNNKNTQLPSWKTYHDLENTDTTSEQKHPTVLLENISRSGRTHRHNIRITKTQLVATTPNCPPGRLAKLVFTPPRKIYQDL